MRAGLIGRLIPKEKTENNGGKAKAETIKSKEPKKQGEYLGHNVLSLEKNIAEEKGKANSFVLRGT